MTQQEKAKLIGQVSEILKRIPTIDTWHPASESPFVNPTDECFLALTKDMKPFLTHYIDGWLPQVHMWQYINIPMHTL